MGSSDKKVVWLHGEVKTPPFTAEARREAGWLLGILQLGGVLSMPRSRPMPAIGLRCHELRVRDASRDWRIVYRIDPDAIIVADVFAKTSRTTPKSVLENARIRLIRYDDARRRGPCE